MQKFILEEAMGKVTDAVRELAAPLCEERGLMLWDVRFEKLGGTSTLSVFVDREDGADIDDCEAISRALEALLDERDAVDGSYSLEVSTPGMERKLERPEHYLFCLGERVEVKFFEARADGRKTLVGVLCGYDEQSDVARVTDEESGEELDFKTSDASRVRLSPDFSVYF